MITFALALVVLNSQIFTVVHYIRHCSFEGLHSAVNLTYKDQTVCTCARVCVRVRVCVFASSLRVEREWINQFAPNLTCLFLETGNRF
jgi:hypothetical protein